jgi:hypothetical protein
VLKRAFLTGSAIQRESCKVRTVPRLAATLTSLILWTSRRTNRLGNAPQTAKTANQQYPSRKTSRSSPTASRFYHPRLLSAAGETPMLLLARCPSRYRPRPRPLRNALTRRTCQQRPPVLLALLASLRAQRKCSRPAGSRPKQLKPAPETLFNSTALQLRLQNRALLSLQASQTSLCTLLFSTPLASRAVQLMLLQASARRAVPALRGRWRRFNQGVSRRPVWELLASGCVRRKRRPGEAEDQPRHVSQPYSGLQRESCCDRAHRLPRDERRRQIRVHA